MGDNNSPNSDSPWSHRVDAEKNLQVNDGADSIGEHARPIDPILEKKVRRKIDLFLMPAMMIGM